MLFTLLVAVLLSWFRSCEGSPTFQEQYRGSYVPEVVEAWHGLQVVAPDTPYVAVAGRDSLYFIDTRFDPGTAKHVKQQIERSQIQDPDEYTFIDELSATAEVRNRATGETTFVFDPAYARVLFAEGLNKHNPELRLPEHEPAGDWLVTYDLDAIFTEKARCNCTLCRQAAAARDRDTGITSTIGESHPLCSKKVDTPKKDVETDASYYERMDKLHWG